MTTEDEVVARCEAWPLSAKLDVIGHERQESNAMSIYTDYDSKIIHDQRTAELLADVMAYRLARGNRRARRRQWPKWPRPRRWAAAQRSVTG
ncbi:MAG: hypothetical protein ACRDVZ_08075 [Jiangellaceae bacterium]